MSDATFVESLMDVVSDHGSNGFTAVRLLQQIGRQSGSSDFRDVLMLADRGDLTLVKTAKVDAILQRNHGCYFICVG
jgi:hypothetical protein